MLRVFLQVPNEEVARDILRFLNIGAAKCDTLDVYRRSQFYLVTFQDDASPALYGKIVNLNATGISIAVQDRTCSEVVFVPWATIRLFKTYV